MSCCRHRGPRLTHDSHSGTSASAHCARVGEVARLLSALKVTTWGKTLNLTGTRISAPIQELNYQ